MRAIDADRLLSFIKLDEQVIAPEKHSAQDIIMIIQTAPTIALPPNDPLTLDELREMDGEPVWNDTMKNWVLIDLTWEYGERTVDAGGKWRGLDDRYYRRKPEEDADGT